MATKEELLRIASRLGCKYMDKCANHTRGPKCPTCWEQHKERSCQHVEMCSPCEAAQALRLIAGSL
jgi:hypothetical protein